MKQFIKSAFAAAGILAAAHASAASISADVPVVFEVVPSCVWRSVPNDPSLLTTPSTTSAIMTQFNVAASCNSYTAYSITADTQSKLAVKNGEIVQISLHPDASRSSYLADAPITGVAGPLFDGNSTNVAEQVYIKVSGEGDGGSFLSGGVIPLTTFTLTISY